MGFQDFEGITPYKLIVPTMQIATWVIMFLGLTYDFQSYRILVLSTLGYLFVKMIFMNAAGIYAAYHTMKILDKVEKKEAYDIPNRKPVYPCIVIPTYNQSVELLSETLQKLAAHPRSKERYLIFLALEDHSKNPLQKGKELVNKFSQKFRLMDFTIHKLRPREQRGKSSNSSWCCQQLEPIFKQNSIDIQDVLYTSLDADSWIPNVYFDEIDLYLSKHNWNMNRYIFAPNQMFTRNHLDVPMFTRVHDQTNGLMHFMLSTNLTNSYFPLSCYSMSFVTLKKMGFFDTNADAIADDYHTAMKAYWKNQGEIQCVPIYTMFNQVNVETGRGYVADVIARFWQAERHVRGLLDVAYNLKMMVNNPFRPRTFWMAINHLELNLLGILSFWLIVSFGLYKLVNGVGATPFQARLFELYTISNFIPYIIYFFLIRRSSQVLYGAERKESFFRILEYMIVISVTVPVFTNIAMVVASVNSLRQNQYTVAQKSCYGGNEAKAKKKSL